MRRLSDTTTMALSTLWKLCSDLVLVAWHGGLNNRTRRTGKFPGKAVVILFINL